MESYELIRTITTQICSSLENEDYVIQPHSYVSPPKWHLAHTSWFFEHFCLIPFFNMEAFAPEYNYLFNSYYESEGTRVAQDRRGIYSRPTVRQIMEYRAHVDRRMREAGTMVKDLAPGQFAEWQNVVELGLHHEQQHQELLLMDIKHILFYQPGHPPLRLSEGGEKFVDQEADEWQESEGKIDQFDQWRHMNSGVYEIGWGSPSFAFDNERSRHRVFLEAYSIANQLVTNAEYASFIGEEGYQRANLWLADGWEWVQKNSIRAPLYWLGGDTEYSLTQGRVELDPAAPVSHVSYFEADAFARWKQCRLPTEGEWEVACASQPKNSVWQWTASAYLPYPGFAPFLGAFAEYNAKFMSGQMVLRGGSAFTPSSHYRPTYRNFFYPEQRWQLSGIRLAK